jgi:hypothetical protein
VGWRRGRHQYTLRELDRKTAPPPTHTHAYMPANNTHPRPPPSTHPCDAEVTQLHDLLLGEKDVLSLEVAVQHGLGVGERQGGCDLGEPVTGTGRQVGWVEKWVGRGRCEPLDVAKKHAAPVAPAGCTPTPHPQSGQPP